MSDELTELLRRIEAGESTEQDANTLRLMLEWLAKSIDREHATDLLCNIGLAYRDAKQRIEESPVRAALWVASRT